MVIILVKGMVYAKMLNGGMMLFSGGMEFPASLSTRVLFIHDIEHTVVTSALGQPNP